MSNISANSGIMHFKGGRPLAQDDIKKLQKPYVATAQSSVSNADTVEITQNKPKQKWYQKYKKYLLIAGATVVAVTAAILGKQKIDANKIKNAEAEAKKLESEAEQKAHEAEEKARIEAEEKLQAQRKEEAEARKKAKLEAEAKAKAEAEEKARIEAEKAKAEENIKMKFVNSKEEIENPKEVQEAMNELRGIQYDPKSSKKFVTLKSSEEYNSATIELKPDGTQVVTYSDIKEPMEFFGGCPKRLIRKTYDKTGKEVNVLVVRPPKNSVITKDYIPDFEILESRNGSPLSHIGKVEDTPYGKMVERNFTSVTGTKSEYKFVPTEKGHTVTYKITDKNGEVLMDTSRTFEKTDENHTRTILKDSTYETEYNEENIIVKKLDNTGKLVDTKVLDLGGEGYIADHYFHIPSNIVGDHSLDKSLMKLYKQIQGDFLYKIAETGTKVRYGEPTGQGACYRDYLNTIFISTKSENSPFTLLHELGHSIDYNMSCELQNNPKLQKTLEETRQLYEAKTSEADKAMYMKYIIGNPEEAPAEAYPVIFGQLDNTPNMAMRTVLYQMDFADYIAEASKIIQK